MSVGPSVALQHFAAGGAQTLGIRASPCGENVAFKWSERLERDAQDSPEPGLYNTVLLVTSQHTVLFQWHSLVAQPRL